MKGARLELNFTICKRKFKFDIGQNKIIGDTIFDVSYWIRDRHFTWSFEPREGLPVCRAKEAPSFLNYFKILSISPVPGIKPATSRSAVKRSACVVSLQNEEYS